MGDFDLASLDQEELDARRRRGDPAADAVVLAFARRAGPAQVGELFDRLIREIELDVATLPPEIREFVERFELPEWLDASRVDLAERVFRAHGPRYLLLLYFKSLPTLYACAKGAAVLAATGRLAHDGAELRVFARRIAETGQFLIRVMEPGGMIGGFGLHTTLKIRLIHASIRHFVTESGWDPDGLGIPINQEDLAITLQSFSSTIVRGLEETGIDLDASERNAIMHHWRVVGHCLGIDADLMPDRYEDGVALEARILARQAEASEAGQLLTRALVTFAEERLPRRFRKAPADLIAYLARPEVEAAIGIDDRLPWWVRLVPDVLRRLFGLTARVGAGVPGLSRTVDAVAVLLTLAMVNSFNNYKEAPFYVPDALKEAWLEPR